MRISEFANEHPEIRQPGDNKATPPRPRKAVLKRAWKTAKSGK